jgi:hypothetical protein
MDEKIFMMIDSYIDGELNRNDEDILFEQLALNPDVRDYLRKVNLVKNQTRLSSGGFPSSLERNILTSVRSRTTPRLSGGARLAGYISAGISIILLVISLFLLGQVSDYRNEIHSVLNRMETQNEMIQALYNSYPAAVVHAQYPNEIIIKPNI